jgi:hypothetical protein
LFHSLEHFDIQFLQFCIVLVLFYVFSESLSVYFVLIYQVFTSHWNLSFMYILGSILVIFFKLSWFIVILVLNIHSRFSDYIIKGIQTTGFYVFSNSDLVFLCPLIIIQLLMISGCTGNPLNLCCILSN